MCENHIKNINKLGGQNVEIWMLNIMLQKVLGYKRSNNWCAMSVHYSSSSSLSYNRSTACSKVHNYQRLISHQFCLEVFYYSNNTQKDCFYNCTLIFRLDLFMVIWTTLRCLVLNLGINHKSFELRYDKITAKLALPLD